MTFLNRARAGQYAEQRYRNGLRSYRSRMRRPLLIVVAPMVMAFCAIALTHTLDPWSLAAGALLASAVLFVMMTRDDLPHHVDKWRRGAEGERKTEKALRPLEHRGWTVEHDIQQNRRANLDHVAKGPRGVFLLETKNLNGTITIEDGSLTTRPLDDPHDVYRNHALGERVRDQAKELCTRIGRETGHRPWVHATVVIWGDFPQQLVEHGDVTYIAGERLAAWLDDG